MAQKPSTPQTTAADKAALLSDRPAAESPALGQGNPRSGAPIVEKWGEDGIVSREGQPSRTRVVTLDADGQPAEPKPAAGESTEANKAAQVMEILRSKRPDDAPTDAPATPEAAEATAEPEAAAPASRKDALKALELEKRHRKLEKELKDTKDRLSVTERAFKEGKLAEIIKSRGLTPEQAVLEVLGEGSEAPAADPDKVTELEKRLDALQAEKQAVAMAQQEAQISAVVKSVLEPLDLPLTKASKRIAVPQADGSARFLPPDKVVAQVAEQMWIDAGSPEGEQMNYLALAATNVEAMLAEEHAGIIEHVRGGKPAPAPRAPAVPALGKRAIPSAGKGGGDFNAIADADERRQAIRQAMFGR